MTERIRYLFPKEAHAGSNPVGRTIEVPREGSREARMWETILDLLFVYGPMRWQELWSMIPDQLRARSGSSGYDSYSRSINRLHRAGWLTSEMPWEPAALTANGWLKLGVGKYPWNYPR